MKKFLALLMGLIMAATVLLVVAATPAQAASCTNLQTPWAYRTNTDYQYDLGQSKWGTAVRYVRCDWADGSRTFRATEVGGRYDTDDPEIYCDTTLIGSLEGFDVNFDNRGGDIFVNHNPPQFRVGCQRDGVNTRWVDLNNQSDKIYARDLDNWYTWWCDCEVSKDDQFNSNVSRWGHLYGD